MTSQFATIFQAMIDQMKKVKKQIMKSSMAVVSLISRVIIKAK